MTAYQVHTHTHTHTYPHTHTHTHTHTHKNPHLHSDIKGRYVEGFEENLAPEDTPRNDCKKKM